MAQMWEPPQERVQARRMAQTEMAVDSIFLPKENHRPLAVAKLHSYTQSPPPTRNH
jgi:hypothetical protein